MVFIVQLYLLMNSHLHILPITENGVEISSCSCRIVSPFSSQCWLRGGQVCRGPRLLVSRSGLGFTSVLFGTPMATSAVTWLLAAFNRFLYFLTFPLFYLWISRESLVRSIRQVFLESIFPSVLSYPFALGMITDKGRACVCHFDVCFLYALQLLHGGKLP